ncbi:MAG: EF-P lysine aminoacylase GenX [Acidobacteriota bacterium]|nr:MAG: EF-P lysine aminoacylase GenX [Acidobacteriota bacterium]
MWQLVDLSDAIDLDPPSGTNEGDLIQGRLVARGERYGLLHVEKLAVRRGPPAAADEGLRDRLRVARERSRITGAIREFFAQRGFIEVSTPRRVVCPGLEPHLVALPAGDDRWLATSPELHLKRLLAAGACRVFELARAFRGDERGPWHLSEFTLLEWYRAHEPLDVLVDDVEQLLRHVTRACGRDLSAFAGCDLRQPAERLTVREAVSLYTGIDLARLRERDALAAALEQLGLHTDEKDDWDDLFFRLMVERVEPRLGRGRLSIVSDYPASQAALARVQEDPRWPVALRFEVYAAGIELANAFDELTDPAEQRRRHQADRAARARAGREVPRLDEAFLAALESGHPPAVGIALGVDRLVALLLGLPTARDTVLFPDEV